MIPLKRNTLSQQTAMHVLEGIREGTWRGTLPGVLRLAAELKVSKDTVRDALHLLEKAGHLHANRPGTRRRIRAARKAATRSLRVGILLPEPLAHDNRHSQTLMLLIRESIAQQGHHSFFVEHPFQKLRNKLDRIAKIVTEGKADAWILYGPTENLTAWFTRRKIPIFCIGSCSANLPYYRVDISPGVLEATRELIRLGHRRIVFIAPPRWKEPLPVPRVQAFVDALNEAGVKASSYHLPEWEISPEGILGLLEQLFRVTPPTALLTAEPGHALAVLGFLAGRGLKVPDDVSLLCILGDPIFRWHHPSIATLDYPLDLPVHCVLDWLHTLESGAPFRGSKTAPATYLPGNSIGPAKGSKLRKG